MYKKIENKKNLIIETIKWIIITSLLTLIIINNYFNNLNQILQNLLNITFVIISIIIIMTTNKGKKTIEFIHNSYTEIKKVVLPTYKETLHTTIIIVIITAIISIFLWILDNIIIYLISFIMKIRL